MRIIIDLQACQSTGSRHRGIGRYSLALAKAMVRNAGEHDIWLLLSSLFPDTIQPLRDAFAGMLPQERIVTWGAPDPVAELVPQNYWRSRAAELLREQALAALRPDFIHVTSLFEGSGDDAVSSVAISGEHLPTAVTLYDLIPLMYDKQYLNDPAQRAWYYRKLASLKRADLLLAISDSSRQEGMDLLQLSPERVVSISSAVDEHFQVRSCSDEVMHALRARYGITRDMAMYTGGIDIRKNIDGLIQAYAGLPLAVRQQHQLAIVCSVQKADRERIAALVTQLQLAEDEIILTGFVPDEDLPLLYQDCKLFVFPSWHEGFGLPALEAMSCGAPVIAANTSSLPEVLEYPDALFDPRDITAITAKMLQVIEQPEFAARLREHGLQQCQKFSWDASAKKALHAIEVSHAHLQQVAAAKVHVCLPPVKPRLAYISPLPPVASGIANYSADLLPELADYYDITLIAEQSQLDAPWLTANFAIHDSQWFVKHAASFDRVLYHFGNSAVHAYMYPLFASYPGIVVLHDYFLSDSLANLEMSSSRPGIWAQHLYLSHGYAALLERRNAADYTTVMAKYPCSSAVLERAEGVIVHSAYAQELANTWIKGWPACQWQQVPLLRRIPAVSDKHLARSKLGLGEQDFVLCSFGMLGPTKLNHVLLDAWQESALSKDAHCHLIFVGKNDPGEYGAQLQERIANGERVRITGFTTAEEFALYMQAADGAVQLRTLSRGETSAAVLECMAYGLPVILNRNGAMAELPADAVLGMPDQFTQKELLQAISKLHDESKSSQLTGQTARQFVQAHHAPALIARSYAEAIEEFALTEPAARMHRSLAAIADISPASPQHPHLQAEVANDDLRELARHLAHCTPRPGKRMVMLDVSTWCESQEALSAGWKAALEAVILARQDLRFEPVCYAGPDFRYARSWTFEQFSLAGPAPADDFVALRAGDLYLDLSGCKDLQIQTMQLQQLGVTCHAFATQIQANMVDLSASEALIAKFLAILPLQTD
ncbi:glycosyltransferase [Undibacterium sp. TC9W]|uniref:glycosyltransferase n=1 Tax=Undibacterium sp. TC9W TaxID=3413053 RepID=UPI003BF203CB